MHNAHASVLHGCVFPAQLLHAVGASHSKLLSRSQASEDAALLSKEVPLRPVNKPSIDVGADWSVARIFAQ